jgi:arsenate reductase
VNIQIIGTKNCTETRKAERFFRERRFPYHFRDLTVKGISEGELENINQAILIEELIDKEGKQFKKRGLEYMIYDIETELFEDSLLLKTPIVRNGRSATVGYKPEVWTEWISDEKNI